MLTISGISAVMAKRSFEKLLQEILPLVSESSRKRINQWRNKNKLSEIWKESNNIRKVKTIWQVDKAVDLFSFYCDAHVELEEKRVRIRSAADFQTSENIILEGIAGQGKSILLRYLCSVELYEAKRFPIFVELRRITSAQRLRQRIQASFKALGVALDDALFEDLAKSGKILLLLDAFDEIPDSIKSEVLTEIEDLADTHKNLQIIITSRPHEAVQMSTRLSVYKLSYFKGDEYKSVINKLTGEKAQAENLISHIENQARHMKELLCTPLLVTLLVMSYKSYQKLPSRLPDFYDGLFLLLLQRHDGSKPGFSRERSCNLDDNEYRRIFETLCLCSKKKGRLSFSATEIHELAQKAIELSNIKVSAQKFVKDIIGITCLIIREGSEHRFIHATVLEYYAASYIRNQPDELARKFYEKCLTLKREASHRWGQELSFLKEIDRYRHGKYYYLPSIKRILGVHSHNMALEELTALQVREIILYELKDFSFTFSINPFELHSFSFRNWWIHDLGFRGGVVVGIDRVFTENAYLAEKLASVAKPSRRSKKENGLLEVPFLSLTTVDDAIDKLCDLLNARLNWIYREAKSTNEFLLSAVQNDILDALLED